MINYQIVTPGIALIYTYIIMLLFEWWQKFRQDLLLSAQLLILALGRVSLFAVPVEHLLLLMRSATSFRSLPI